MDKTIKQRVLKTEDVAIKKFCDVCGEEIKAHEPSLIWNRVDPRGRPWHTVKYLSVTTGHHDWGNDSIDSVETHDVCSTECLAKFMQRFYSEFNKSKTYGTDYIHIDSGTDYVYPECPPFVDKE